MADKDASPGDPMFYLYVPIYQRWSRPLSRTKPDSQDRDNHVVPWACLVLPHAPLVPLSYCQLLPNLTSKFRHHNYIDRLWWQWQQADGENRLFWISGNTVNETLYPSQIGINATLDYVLQLSDIVPDVKAVEVMNAQGGFLCYDYDY